MSTISSILLSASKRNRINGLLAFALILSITTHPSKAQSNQESHYEAVPGLIDLRSTFSNGVHSIEELVQIASSRGFRVVFINDHDRIALSCGIPPFRRVLRYKKEFPSIMTHGPDAFLEEIERVSKKYP
ncbi:MAG: hypothetical protein JRF50_17920, partial [Deltaproteobacteria bacterium]|nr:hypothetical protein [Deltaproteobacteria bacterium]